MDGQKSEQKEKLTRIICKLAEQKGISLEKFIAGTTLDIKALFESTTAAGLLPEQLYTEINQIMK